MLVDRYGDFAVVEGLGENAASQARAVSSAVSKLGAAGVYLKIRVRGDLRRLPVEQLTPKEPVLGEPAPAELQVTEQGRRYSVRLADGFSTGLFFDQRDNRGRVQTECQGHEVLNLFCYTGSFSVAAGLGKAARVTSVDSSGQALKRVDHNLRLNVLPQEQHRLLRADARNWLRRAERRDQRFDWIILDPPSFSSQASDTFSVEKDYAALLASCFRLLSSRGRLLAVTNHRSTRLDTLEKLVREASAVASRSVTTLEHCATPVDCNPSAELATATKALLVAVT